MLGNQTISSSATPQTGWSADGSVRPSYTNSNFRICWSEQRQFGPLDQFHVSLMSKQGLLNVPHSSLPAFLLIGLPPPAAGASLCQPWSLQGLSNRDSTWLYRGDDDTTPRCGQKKPTAVRKKNNNTGIDFRSYVVRIIANFEAPLKSAEKRWIPEQ